MTSPVKPIPTFIGFPASSVYANQCVAYVPINQIAQYGVPAVVTTTATAAGSVQPGQPGQHPQYPHIVDVGNNAAFYPNAAHFVQPLPTEGAHVVTGTSMQSMPNTMSRLKGSQSLPNMPIQYPSQSAIPSIPLVIAPLHPCKPPMTVCTHPSNENPNQDSNSNMNQNQDADDSKSSEDKSSSDQDAEVITNENVMSQPQVIAMPMINAVGMTDVDILKSIEFEKKTTAQKSDMLNRNMREYTEKLSALKKGCEKSCKRLKILMNVYGDNWREDLQEMLREREFEFNTYSETYAQRMFHARQLDIVTGEHYQLTQIAESLSLRLRTVVNEYQSLNATIDVSGASGPFNPDGAMAISNNVHFKQLIAANRKTERQIKFMKTIIENELERNDDGCGQMQMQMQMEMEMERKKQQMNNGNEVKCKKQMMKIKDE